MASAGITWVYLIAPLDYVGVPLLAGFGLGGIPGGRPPAPGLPRPPLLRPASAAAGGTDPGVGILLLLVADVSFARLASIGAYGVGSWLDAVFHASYLCFAVAACHPTMRALTDVILATTSAIAFFLLTFRTGVLNTTLAVALNRKGTVPRERILSHLGTVLVPPTTDAPSSRRPSTMPDRQPAMVRRPAPLGR